MFGGLNGVAVSGIAHVGFDGLNVTALAGPAAAGASASIVGTCTAVALDPQDPDAVYVGLAPSGICGGMGLPASAAGLCKWSWSAQSWTLVARTFGNSFTVIIRSISAAGSTVFFGGIWTSCAAPGASPGFPSQSFCKIVRGVVMGAYNRDMNAWGITPSFAGTDTPPVRAIVAAGAVVPSWIATTGADMSTAQYVCGMFTTAGGNSALRSLFIAANDASNASNTLYLPVWRDSLGAPVTALDRECMAATRIDNGARIAFGGFFQSANGGTVPAQKMVAFDGFIARAVSPTMPYDGSAVIAMAQEPVSGWLYAATSSTSLNFATFGYMLRVNMSSGEYFRVMSSSGIPGVQLQPRSPGTWAAVPCSPTRAALADDACKPLSLATLPDGRLIVGGSMEVVDGTTLVNGLTYWDGAQWMPFSRPGAGANDIVYATAPLNLGSMAGSSASGAFLMGGAFTAIGGTPARGAAIVQPVGAFLPSLPPMCLARA